MIRELGICSEPDGKKPCGDEMSVLTVTSSCQLSAMLLCNLSFPPHRSRNSASVKQACQSYHPVRHLPNLLYRLREKDIDRLTVKGERTDPQFPAMSSTAMTA